MSSPSSALTEKNYFIRAGAGAGKTTRLVATFLEFVESYRIQSENPNQSLSPSVKAGQVQAEARPERRPWPRIVITTFTRKATQEVRERLLVKALQKNNPALFQYMNKKSLVHISTIHGLLGLFLSQYFDDMGYSSDMRVLDSTQLRRKNFKELKLLFKENPQYFDLLDHYSFFQILDLLQKTYDASMEYADLTFFDKEDLKKFRTAKIQSIVETLDEVLSQPIPSGKSWSSYFDFLNAFKLALKTDLKQAQDLFLAKPRKPPFSKEKPPFDVDVHQKLTEVIGEKGLFLSLDSDDYIETNHTINKLFFDLFVAFKTKVRERNLKNSELSLSEIETLSLQILTSQPDKGKKFAEQFDFFMVDEFQDTSPLQVKILNEFLRHRPHFIVGDPQQSIYLFRGARSEVFLQKEAEAQKENYEKLLLNTNYRTRPSLMNFINDFFKDFSRHFSAMIPCPTQDKFKSVGDIPEATFISAENETYAALNAISELIKKGVSPSQICVLSSKNSALLDLAQEAATYHIPVQLMVAAGFDSRREILDLVALLKFLVNPYDNENLVTLIRGPWFKMTDQELVSLRHASKEKPSALWIEISKMQNNDALFLQELRKTYHHEGVLSAVLRFLKETSFLTATHQMDPSGKREANIWKFVRNLRDELNQKNFLLNEYITLQFSQLQGGSHGGVHGDLGSSLGEAQPAQAPDRVQLMTVHNSKGLEFEHVLVLGFSQAPSTTKSSTWTFDPKTKKLNIAIFSEEDSQTQSSQWAQGLRQEFNEREVAESERLLYVAMTRAIYSLTLIAEEKNRVLSLSWKTKCAWPNYGEFEKNGYKVVSKKDDQAPQVFSQQQNSKTFSLRRPYFEIADLNRITQIQHKNSATAVTELVQADLKNVGVSSAESALKNLQKAQQGSRLHRFFESMKYIHSDNIDHSLEAHHKAAFRFLNRQSILPLKEILDQGHVEWAFGLQTPNGLVQGQIDAWSRLAPDVYILDYKTGDSKYVDKAYQQLMFYAQALKRMGFVENQDQVHLVVIYPFEEKIEIKTVKSSEIDDLTVFKT